MLHNMSVRPATQVAWHIPPMGEAMVRFDLASIEAVLAESPIWRGVKEMAGGSWATRHEPGSELRGNLARRLDQAWQEYGLQGAIHIYPWAIAQAAAGAMDLTVLRATEPALVLNVLARSRSQLLLPSMPLALEPTFLTRELATDDPRLAELVRRTSFREGKKQ